MPTVDQLGKAQDQVVASPLGFVAAFFALAFAVLFFAYLRRADKHALAVAALNREHDAELAAVNADRLKMAIEQTSVFATFLPVLIEVRDQMKRRRRSSHGEGLTVVEPPMRTPEVDRDDKR